MQKLSKREEEIMQIIWRLEQAFAKEVINEMPDPKPHYNTVATIMRILEDKGFLAHESFGKTFRYYPIVSKEDYKARHLKDIVKKYFDESYPQMLAYFAKKEDLSQKDLKEILEIINSKKS